MATFKILIEETLTQTYEIEAETSEEAVEIVEKRYNNGDQDYVLTGDDFSSVEIKDLDTE